MIKESLNLFCQLNDEVTKRVEELIAKLGNRLVIFYKDYEYKIIGKEIHIHYKYDDGRTAQSMRIPIEYVLDIDKGVAKYQFDKYIKSYLEDIEELKRNKIRADAEIQKIEKRIEELTEEFKTKNV